MPPRHALIVKPGSPERAAVSPRQVTGGMAPGRLSAYRGVRAQTGARICRTAMPDPRVPRSKTSRPKSSPVATEGQRLGVLLAPDGSEATLTMPLPDGGQLNLQLPLDHLTQLIHALGAARAAMMAKRPVPSMDGASIEPVFVTNWAVQPEALTEGSVIAFQHPAYGPVGFVLPPADAERIVRALGTHLGMVHSRESGDRPS